MISLAKDFSESNSSFMIALILHYRSLRADNE